MTSTKKMHVKLLFAAFALIIGCTPAPPTPEPTPLPGSTTVYLVRHAEKVPSIPGELDPSISAAGKARAKQLASRLGTAGVTAIVTTQFKRTHETAEPIATAIGVTPEVITAGRPGDADSVAAFVLRHRGEKVLIVGHSLTIPGIIEALGGPQLSNICENQYSDLFIMFLPPSGPAQLVRQHYGRGDPPLPRDCSAIVSP
jgi:phosphohistidine phosphatase SixA